MIPTQRILPSPFLPGHWIVIRTLARFVRLYLFRTFALLVWDAAVIYFRYKHCGGDNNLMGTPDRRYPTLACLEWHRFLRLDTFLGVGSVMLGFLMIQGWFRFSDAGKEWNEIQMASWDMGFSLLKRTRKPEDASPRDHSLFEEGIMRALALVAVFPILLLAGIRNRSATYIDLDSIIKSTVDELKSDRHSPFRQTDPFKALCINVAAFFDTMPSRADRRPLTESTFDALHVIYTLTEYIERLVDEGNLEEKRVAIARDSVRTLHKRLIYCDYYQSSEQIPRFELIVTHIACFSVLFFTPWRLHSAFGWWGLIWGLPIPIVYSHSFKFLRRLWFPCWTREMPFYLCLRVASDVDNLWREYEDPVRGPRHGHSHSHGLGHLSTALSPTASVCTDLDYATLCSECAEKCSYYGCAGSLPDPDGNTG